MTARWPKTDITEEGGDGGWIVTHTTRTPYGVQLSAVGRHAKLGQARNKARRAIKAAVKAQNAADEAKARRRLEGK